MTDLADLASDVRIDLKLIADLIEPGSRVLDIGCGDGALLELLERTRGVDARGIEISQEGVNAAVGRGLSVIQGDADSDLVQYPDQSFDYVVLSHTIQATRNARRVLEEMLRIGRRVVVSLPNFGHLDVRFRLMFLGRMPRQQPSAVFLVRHAQHPFLHHSRLRRTGQGRRRPCRPGDRARRLRQAVAVQPAMDRLERSRRAGGVSSVARRPLEHPPISCDAGSAVRPARAAAPAGWPASGRDG